MTTTLPPTQSPDPSTEVFYPSSDGEPLAETSVHVDAIIQAVVGLRQYLTDSPLAESLGGQAIALADQFLYYAQGYPRLRVSPDIMVIFKQERERAEQERQRAEQAEAEIQRLRDQLRALGSNPDP